MIIELAGASLMLQFLLVLCFLVPSQYHRNQIREVWCVSLWFAFLCGVLLISGRIRISFAEYALFSSATIVGTICIVQLLRRYKSHQDRKYQARRILSAQRFRDIVGEENITQL